MAQPGSTAILLVFGAAEGASSSLQSQFFAVGEWRNWFISAPKCGQGQGGCGI